MSESNKALVRRLFEETGSRNGQIPEGLCAPDFTVRVAGSPPLDLATFQQHIHMYYAAFSDFTQTVDDLVAEGDRVAARVTAEAVHTGEFMGVPPSGKRISYVNIGIARIRDDQIVEWWASPDQLSVMRQLGLVPEPQAAR
jgi:predicted ester cyclase